MTLLVGLCDLVAPLAFDFTHKYINKDLSSCILKIQNMFVLFMIALQRSYDKTYKIFQSFVNFTSVWRGIYMYVIIIIPIHHKIMTSTFQLFNQTFKVSPTSFENKRILKFECRFTLLGEINQVLNFKQIFPNETHNFSHAQLESLNWSNARFYFVI